MPNILIIDDELSIRESFLLILADKYNVLLASSGEEALDLVLKQKDIDLAYIDIRMPGLDGIATLRKIKQHLPALEAVMVTAVNDVQKASEAVRLGAHDYVVKPFEVDHILKLTENLLRKRAIINAEKKPQKTLADKKPINLGQSEKILKVLAEVNSLSPGDRVLLAGDAGTEKELIALLIHEKRTGSKQNFANIFLGAHMGAEQIRETLKLAKPGQTLFIDNYEYAPKDFHWPAVIAGSTQDLELENFKKIRLPALKGRVADIPVLAKHFLEKFNLAYRNKLSFSQEALDLLSNYSWPGNTAELEAVIEKLVLSLNNCEILSAHLPLAILTFSSKSLGQDIIADFEKQAKAAGLNAQGRI